MKKRQIFIALVILFSLSSMKSFAGGSSYGIVNFPTCVTESKYGKQEQEAFENVKSQMTQLITDVDSQLKDIDAKLNDAEFIDSLSPEAEQEMKARYQTLGEELNQYHNQYMQVMQQANMKLIQVMSQHVSKASQAIAKREKMPMIVREEACFFYEPNLDITTEIVKEMDKNFDKEQAALADETKK